MPNPAPLSNGCLSRNAIPTGPRSLTDNIMKTTTLSPPSPSSVSVFPVGSREGGERGSPFPKHVVLFSGGIGSWAAGKRVAAKHGTDGLVLLFTDVKMEDPDLYRFLHEAAANIGGDLVIITEGRTPWQVFEDVRYIGNSRVDPCSKVLKRQMLDKWRDANCLPEHTTMHVGIDWTEKHRLDKLQTYVTPWVYEAPLIAPPYHTKQEMLAALEAEGIRMPRLYELGFSHNNCGGFCVKAGHSHFRHLLFTLPSRYAEHEAHEERLRATGINGIILRDRTGGVTTPMTLREFRERIESQPEWFTADDLAAGCGCAL